MFIRIASMLLSNLGLAYEGWERVGVSTLERRGTHILDTLASIFYDGGEYNILLLSLEEGLPKAPTSQTFDPLVSSPLEFVPTASKKTSELLDPNNSDLKILETPPKILEEKEGKSPQDSDGYSVTNTNLDQGEGGVDKAVISRKSRSSKAVCIDPSLYSRRVKDLSSPEERLIVGRMSIEALVGKAHQSEVEHLQKRISVDEALITKLKDHALVMQKRHADDLEIMEKTCQDHRTQL
ncbi:hypothetical protein L1987_46439 [Smallanthus sonchifolius]|uniref:Uncharacterized protein n=1 Tax=Smallanthus sonchifolius TaxID=185202 RepID=A0ACB9G1H6_9ASTR|nr:hypothetical protein L1987_46439 [Smallanthus sonchifolius]